MKKRSAYALFWLSLWIVVAIFMFAFFAISSTSYANPIQWDSQYIALCCELALLILSAPLIIWFDNGEGRGLKNVYRAVVRSRLSLDDGAVSGMLSVLSIRAAITFGVLVALVTWQEKTGDPHLVTLPIAWKELGSSPLGVIFATIIVILGLSIITTLVASLCYEYSIKVDWGCKSKVKLQLRQKGHWFGVIGFYCLMWSLAAITALLNADVCMAAIVVIFLVMWWFYFFPIDVLEVITQPASSVSPTSATLNGIAACDVKNAYFEWGTSTNYGNKIQVSSTGATAPFTLTANLTQLTANTTYYFRLVVGTVTGLDLTFKTP